MRARLASPSAGGDCREIETESAFKLVIWVCAAPGLARTESSVRPLVSRRAAEGVSWTLAGVDVSGFFFGMRRSPMRRIHETKTPGKRRFEL